MEESNRKMMDEVITELHKRYFLVSRTGFWATLFGAIIVVGGVSWTTARSVLVSSSTQQHLDTIESGATLASELKNGNHTLPSGTVVAVTGGNHVDDIEEICPAGWTHFKEGIGRTLIGAGVETANTSERVPMTFGGSETTPHNEPAPHQHYLFASTGPNAKRGPKPGEVIASSASYGSGGLTNKNFEYQIRPGKGKAVLGASSHVGSDTPLPNMQPFFAITFCKKV